MATFSLILPLAVAVGGYVVALTWFRRTAAPRRGKGR